MKDYFKYQGKVCVVTGASSGMGYATAEMLVSLGARVYALDMNPCMVEGIEKFIQVNLADQDSVDHAFEQLPTVFDCFFGVAGLSGSKTDYKTTFHVNYTSNVYMTETYLHNRMRAGGSILYVTSTAGIAWKENIEECKQVMDLKNYEEVSSKLNELIDARLPGMAAYMYSKRCMNAYANQVAIIFGKEKIRVNTVLPGSTDTGMKDEFAQMAGGIDNMIACAGMAGRLATSEEMAMPMVFLNSNMASFVSGIDFIIDYDDSAMVNCGVKPLLCGGPAIIKLPEA